MRTSLVLAFTLATSVAIAASGVTFTDYTFAVSDGRHITVGYRFTANTDFEVGGLGAFDHLADGLLNSHEVGLWDGSTAALLASATVLTGTTSTLDGFFRYEPIAPVTLTAGNPYVVGAFYEASGPDLWNFGEPAHYTNFQVAPQIAYGYGRYTYDTFGMPGTQYGDRFYGGGNIFIGTVPEPATLTGLGLALLLGSRLRKRRA